MINKQIIIGDISANSLQLPIYQVNVQQNIDSLTITYDNLKINQPISFTVLVNDEVYYPDIIWNTVAKNVKLNFGISMSGKIVKIIK